MKIDKNHVLIGSVWVVIGGFIGLLVAAKVMSGWTPSGEANRLAKSQCVFRETQSDVVAVIDVPKSECDSKGNNEIPNSPTWQRIQGIPGGMKVVCVVSHDGASAALLTAPDNFYGPLACDAVKGAGVVENVDTERLLQPLLPK